MKKSISAGNIKSIKKPGIIIILVFLIAVSGYYLSQTILESPTIKIFDFTAFQSLPTGWESSGTNASVLCTTTGWTVTKSGDKPLGILKYHNSAGEKYTTVSIFCMSFQSNANYYIYPSGYKSENKNVFFVRVGMGSLSCGLASNDSILTQTIAQGIPNINRVNGIIVHYLSKPNSVKILLSYENGTRINRIESFQGFTIYQTFSLIFEAYLAKDKDSQFAIEKVEFSNEKFDANYEPRAVIPAKSTLKLIFQDEFYGKTLDTEKWEVTLHPNPSVFVNDGSLKIETKAGINSSICLISRENTIKSPINVTFRARIESFDDSNFYAGWIYSKETAQEADVLEVWVEDTQYFSVHAPGNEWINSYEAKPVDLSLWHDYTMLITQGGCECYIDAELVMQCFGLDADDFDVRISIWNTAIAPKDSVLLIDYVRIYSCSNLNWNFSNVLT